MKNILLIYFLYSVMTSCDNSKEKILKKSVKIKEAVNEIIYDTLDNKEELKIWDTISKLPEVISRIKYVDKISNGKRRLQISTSKKPDYVENFYWIKVSEDNGITIVAHFNFFVYPDNEIKYFDTVNNTILSLEDWRKK